MQHIVCGLSISNIYFSFQCYSIPDSPNINFVEIAENFRVQLEQRVRGDDEFSESVSIPDSFVFFDASDLSNPELQKLEEERSETSELADQISQIYTANPPSNAEWIIDSTYCDRNPCVYISTGEGRVHITSR